MHMNFICCVFPRNERSKPMAGNETSAQKPEDEGKNRRKKIKDIFTVHQAPYLRMWNIIFVISCVFAVSMDPLFFYVVIIDQDKKCLQMDKTLRIVALLMRSLTDVIFLMHFICEICDSVQKTKSERNSGTGVDGPPSKTNTLKNGLSAAVEQTRRNSSKTMETKPRTSKTNKNGPSAEVEQTGGNSGEKSKIRELIQYAREMAQNMSSLSIILDVLALLPLPQLLIVFYPMKRSGFVEHQKVVNVFFLGQYVPRIFRIHLSAKVFNRSNGIWAKSLFNLFLYILASHVLGAFWYVFSILREVSCWYETCVNRSIDLRECTDAFYCDSRSTTARNITLLNEHCQLDTPDGASSSFNFGIFLDSLKNQNTEHKKFIKKFLYSFWWGLRNLSNFGTNLTTSTYVWENLFAILISFIGLLLFLYLIANVQTLIQMEATKSEETRRKIGIKKVDVRTWISVNKFPDNIKKEIENSIEQAWVKDKYADVHNPFLILPKQTKDSVKCHLFMDTLRTVKVLKHMDEYVLTLLCNYLKPMTYNENSFVFRAGDPLDCMVFIIEGTMWTYASSDSQVGRGISSMAIKRLGKCQFYGEELLDRASDCFTELPVSSKHVKSQTKVEAFVLMAKDLETVVSRCPLQWENGEKKGSQEVKDMAASTIAIAYRRKVLKDVRPYSSGVLGPSA
ncbi:cyclic nucleotide-gated ion channel 1-like isoform X2 [Pyrus x bretschneideri]|uniref:cyclic nucleotide-gated ion channel 1-like isoform X2 n=1 Tax=Pyrus x bretschneideri TaxID=225117 RepID=UPI00202E5CD5|nr:cyclic nucleotide-gated ion channel 1-like isoform X2 [Pyrus x bretschneideri]